MSSLLPTTLPVPSLPTVGEDLEMNEMNQSMDLDDLEVEPESEPPGGGRPMEDEEEGLLTGERKSTDDGFVRVGDILDGTDGGAGRRVCSSITLLPTLPEYMG